MCTDPACVSTEHGWFVLAQSVISTMSMLSKPAARASVYAQIDHRKKWTPRPHPPRPGTDCDPAVSQRMQATLETPFLQTSDPSSEKSTVSSISSPSQFIAKSRDLPAAVGSGMYIRFSRRRRNASSRSHGLFVAAKTCVGHGLSGDRERVIATDGGPW